MEDVNKTSYLRVSRSHLRLPLKLQGRLSWRVLGSEQHTRACLTAWWQIRKSVTSSGDHRRVTDDLQQLTRRQDSWVMVKKGETLVEAEQESADLGALTVGRLWPGG